MTLTINTDNLQQSLNEAISEVFTAFAEEKDRQLEQAIAEAEADHQVEVDTLLEEISRLETDQELDADTIQDLEARIEVLEELLAAAETSAA